MTAHSEFTQVPHLGINYLCARPTPFVGLWDACVFITVGMLGALIVFAVIARAFLLAAQERFPSIPDPAALIEECEELIKKQEKRGADYLLSRLEVPPEIRRLGPRSAGVLHDRVLIHLSHGVWRDSHRTRIIAVYPEDGEIKKIISDERANTKEVKSRKRLDLESGLEEGGW